MITVRKSKDRGHVDHGWLDARHTFSFGAYHDPAHMHFRSLRVMNEDRVQPGQGFGTHPHRDMEILTYVLSGELSHKDSMGHSRAIKPGEVQCMTAGTGITHSEFNASQTEPVHLYQVWIIPERRGLTPAYDQKSVSIADEPNTLKLIASRPGEGGLLTINQDAKVYAAALEPGAQINHALAPERHAWLQVVRGELTLNGVTLQEGDGAAISQELSLQIASDQGGELLLFDLA